MSHQFFGKTKIFLDTSKHESKKKRRTCFFQRNKSVKENQKGESQKKTRNKFSRH